MDFGTAPAFNHGIDGPAWVEVGRIRPHKRARYLNQQRVMPSSSRVTVRLTTNKQKGGMASLLSVLLP